ncbi:hypothetical protein BDR26DRAFT_854667, partial [Obelidium mucronatum]
AEGRQQREEEEVGGVSGGPGWMVLVVRGWSAFEVHWNHAEKQLQHLNLSLLPSLNPQQSYAILTTFFRDADLIPSPSSSLRRRRDPYMSLDDPEYIPNPAAIPLSLVSPPRGGYGFCVLKPVPTTTTTTATTTTGFGYVSGLLKHLFEKQRRQEECGFVLCGVRYMSVSEGFAERMDEVLRRSGGGGESGGGGDGEFGNCPGVLVVVLWGVCVMKRLKKAILEYSALGQQPVHQQSSMKQGKPIFNSNKQQHQQHKASNTPTSSITNHVYMAPCNATTHQQLSLLFPRPHHVPTPFPVEVRDFPTQLGGFQRKIITRRPMAVPVPERRVIPVSTAAADGSGYGWESCLWKNGLKCLGVCLVVGSGGGGLVKVVGWSYFVASEGLAERMVSCHGGGEGGGGDVFTVHNVLNGPCMVIALEARRDSLEIKLTVCLNHQETMALVPLVFGELVGAVGYRIGVVPSQVGGGVGGY